MRIALRPWREDDRALLHALLGDADAMRHLGGPEAPERIDARHERYVGFPWCFAIVDEASGAAVGWIGAWDAEWGGEAVTEVGWHVLASAQGRGVATRALQLLVADLRAARRHRFVHAFPGVENAASNAVARKAGFALRGECVVDFPKDRPMRANDWRLDLGASGGR